jgi:hypothetical protein
MFSMGNIALIAAIAIATIMIARPARRELRK